MNDDTDGHNKAITGVCRQCFVKEAGFLRGPRAGLCGPVSPEWQSPCDFPPSLFQGPRP